MGDNSNILINILTRTHNRLNYFKVCRESVLNQTHEKINHIVGSDIDCYYYENYIKLVPQKVIYPKPDGLASYEAPWNLHLNELGKYVRDGWVMYLDDDDKFVSSDSLKSIVSVINSEDEMILWRVDINGVIYPNDRYFGKIIPGNISGIGFMFHSKYLPVYWHSWNFGDYRVINELSKKIKQRWINSVLTQTQGKPNHGKTPMNL